MKSLYAYEFNSNNNVICIYSRHCEYDMDTDAEICTLQNLSKEDLRFTTKCVKDLFQGKESYAYYWLARDKETGKHFPLPLLTDNQKELVLNQLEVALHIEEINEFF